MYGNNFCDFCKTDEDYSHYFITCAFFNEFWGKQSKFNEEYEYRNHNFFKHIVLGYNIYEKTYLTLDFLLNRML